MADLDTELYYFPQESKQQYSETALGDPDINRLVEGKADFWMNPTLPRVRKKKTLVLTSDNPTRWSHYNTSILGAKMLDLMESGFQIYLFENGKLTALTLHNLTTHFASALKNMPPTYPDDATEAAIDQLKLIKDQTHPLDDAWFECQHHEKNTFDGHTIYAQWFKDHNEQQRKKLIAVLQQSRHPVSRISYEAYTDTPLDWLKPLIEAFPKATLIKTYQKVLINGKREAAKFVTEIISSEQSFPDLSWLCINCAQVSTTHLIKIFLEKAPNINSIKLQELSGDIEIPPDSLPRLQVIQLVNCTLTLSALKKILAAAPQLSQLALVRCTIIGNSSAEMPPLLNLTNVQLMHCVIENSPLKKLLTTVAPHLEQLTLFSNEIEHEDIGTIHFPRLVELVVDRDQTIIPATLSQIAPKLQRFIFNGPADDSMQPLIGSLSKEMSVHHPMVNGLTEISSDPTTSIDPTQSTDSTHLHKSKNSRAKRQAGENNSQELDADTSLDPNKKFDVTRIFYSTGKERHPEVSHYRLNVYHEIKINDQPCPLANAFTLNKEGDLNLVPRAIAKSSRDVYERAKQLRDKKYSHYYGKQTLHLNHEWQALASLTPNDEILSYHLSTNTDIDILYSTRDNLYYIRTKNQSTAQTIDIDFILRTPKEKPALPPTIQHIVDDYLAFGEGALDITTTSPTGHDYLQAIQEQKRGACRHRALAFKALMKKIHPALPVHILTNDCHAFVEVNINGQWVGVNLGGYDAKLDIDDSNQPTLTSTASTSTIAPPTEAPTFPVDHKPATTPEEKYLETWSKRQLSTKNMTQYCQQLVRRDNGNQRLIELSSTDDVHAMQYAVQHHCLRTQHPIFYVDSPEDLVCSSTWIAPHEVNGEVTGELKAGPGGRLHHFLTAKPTNEHRILLINYEHFSPADIVRCNSLLDKDRMIDGVAIPPSMTIIGLTNTKSPNYYQGSDFSSRFNSKPPAPSSETLQAAVRPHLITPKTRTLADTKIAPISLYHASSWKDMLLGRWIMNGHHLTFEEGKLQAAVRTGLPIVIQQGLWDNEAFRHFWEQAKLHGRIDHSGGSIHIPPDLQLIRDDHYDWENIVQNIRCEPNPPAHAVTLNPGQLNQFFNRYRCDNTTKTLHHHPGLLAEIAKGADKILHVHLTRELNVDQWARLGDACNQHQVQLIVHPAAGVSLPEDMPIEFNKTALVSQPWDKNLGAIKGTFAIDSSDLDTTVAMLTSDNASWQVIDISAGKANDLLTHIQPTFDKETVSFQFTETKRVLLNALEENKKVILKGHFSAELIDELAPLLRSRCTNGGPGQLVLVGDDATLFNFMDSHTHHVSLEDKQYCLRQDHFSDVEIKTLPEDIKMKASLSRIRARLIYQRIHPDEPSDNAWLGMYDLPNTPHLEDLLAADDSKAIAETFNHDRIEEVFNLLHHAPYAYLTGLTGVGKTTFVEKHIKTDPRVNFFHGDASIKNWASEQSTDKLNILFIDEVNLSHRPWSEFEGLFHNPPGILIDGTYYPLSKQHKVIFAGNPIAYGDERQLVPTFANHGNALLFDPLPLASIYEDILKPIYANTTLAVHSWDLCQPFLTVYRFLCEHAQNEVLISPRELQMMALLVLSYMEQHPGKDGIAAAKYYAYHVTKQLVPPIHYEAFTALPLVNEAKKISLNKPSKSNKNLHFLLTPSRQKIAEQLIDLLTLRELRQSKTDEYNLAKLYGGLGGLVLTGEPGIGKSEIVIAILRQQGYQEVHFPSKRHSETNATTPGKKIFYRMPVNLPLSVKQTLLLKAFDEGAVVVVDELNSSPMMERWFNDLLMGKNPLTNKPPLHPGFMLIGTQNPPNKAGRNRASTAAARRIIQTTVPPYPHQEMCDILISKGLHQKKAKRLVRTYEDNRDYAKHLHLSPEPTFRDLLAAAEIAKKRTFSYALKQLNKTIAAQPNKKIKMHAIAVRDNILKLQTKGGEKLASYLILTNALLIASPSARPRRLIKYQQKAMEAHGHFSTFWRNLSAAMLLLGVVIGITAGTLLVTTGIGTLPGIAITTSSVALLTTSMGVFAYNHPKGLSKAMSELHTVMDSPLRATFSS